VEGRTHDNRLRGEGEIGRVVRASFWSEVHFGWFVSNVWEYKEWEANERCPGRGRYSRRSRVLMLIEIVNPFLTPGTNATKVPLKCVELEGRVGKHILPFIDRNAFRAAQSYFHSA
jgi:hypothetical protein